MLVLISVVKSDLPIVLYPSIWNSHATGENLPFFEVTLKLKLHCTFVLPASISNATHCSPSHRCYVGASWIFDHITAYSQSLTHRCAMSPETSMQELKWKCAIFTFCKSFSHSTSKFKCLAHPIPIHARWLGAYCIHFVFRVIILCRLVGGYPHSDSHTASICRVETWRHATLADVTFQRKSSILTSSGHKCATGNFQNINLQLSATQYMFIKSNRNSRIFSAKS